MAEFTTTSTYTVNCPGCAADRVIKIGKQSGEQRYQCKTCKKKFRAGGKAQGRKMDAEMMGSAIRDHYTGKSYKQIAEGLREEYDLPNEPSKATVYEWVRDYTGKALKQMEGHKATTGGRWVADEMQVDVGGKKVWLWNVMDSRDPLHSGLAPNPQAGCSSSSCCLEKGGAGRRQAAEVHHHGQAPVVHSARQRRVAGGHARTV